MAKVKLTFCGGAGEVTGANYLLEVFSGTGADKKPKARFLIDCGMFQGEKMSEDKNHEPFPFDPSSVDAVFITHAHLDHVGRLPKLIRDGFKGAVYSTFPTRDFSELSLTDSVGILEKEQRKNGHKPMIYSLEDIQKTMSLWTGVEYGEEVKLENLTVVFKDAGHILGSAFVEFKINGKKFVFGGDSGNSPNPLLRDCVPPTDADYMIIESVYGDKEHETVGESNIKLERTIEDTVKAGGVLMIPAFSFERTQLLLFEINELVEHGRIPKVPIFLDSPLAINATKVYRKYTKYYGENAKKIMGGGDDLFNFPGLKMTPTKEDSMAINDVRAPKIIIAGSGSSTGGRIVHHERRYLPDPKSTLLMTGYQAPGSLGRKIVDGIKSISIGGEMVEVKAKIEHVGGYSAHADRNGLFDFIRASEDFLIKVFAVQGEIKASSFLAQRTRDYLGIDAVVPQAGESFEFEI